MENLLIDLDREIASTRRLLERYPLGKGGWRPHDKSRTLSELATHVANIPGHCASILTTAEMDVATRQPLRQPVRHRKIRLLQIQHMHQLMPQHQRPVEFLSQFARRRQLVPTAEVHLAGVMDVGAGESKDT